MLHYVAFLQIGSQLSTDVHNKVIVTYYIMHYNFDCKAVVRLGEINERMNKISC